jgi:hypothetical protein
LFVSGSWSAGSPQTCGAVVVCQVWLSSWAGCVVALIIGNVSPVSLSRCVIIDSRCLS